MKPILLLSALMLIVIFSDAQGKGIKVDQLFITNKVTGKSVKLFSDEEKLKNFGELVEMKKYDLQYTTSDYAKYYLFSNIIFYISTEGKISSFRTASPDIKIEKNGFFTISVGAKIAELERYFPDEVKSAVLVNYGKEKKQYLDVDVPLFDYNPFLKKDSQIDFAISYMFNPQSKILEMIYLWIRP